MPRLARIHRLAAVSLASIVTAVSPAAHTSGATPLPIVGRWDVTITSPDGARHPSWFEIREDAHGLAMRMVARYGGPSDVPFVAWDGRHLEFEPGDGRRWRADFNGRWFSGSIDPPAGFPGMEHAYEQVLGHRVPSERPSRWTAVRAPVLRARDVGWGKPERIFDGRTLSGWRPRHVGPRSGWTVRDGALSNTRPAVDLVSLEQYQDFKLHLQFRLQPGQDSGVHLRGRYEVQLTDREDPASHAGSTGAIYGMIAPDVAANAIAGAWNTLDVTLVGRTVSVSLNGDLLIDRRSIPGITGDALDADEGRPGPIVLQGYLGRVEYRDVEVTPAL